MPASRVMRSSVARQVSASSRRPTAVPSSATAPEWPLARADPSRLEDGAPDAATRELVGGREPGESGADDRRRRPVAGGARRRDRDVHAPALISHGSGILSSLTEATGER